MIGSESYEKTIRDVENYIYDVKNIIRALTSRGTLFKTVIVRFEERLAIARDMLEMLTKLERYGLGLLAN